MWTVMEIIVTYILPSIPVLALIVGFLIFYFQNKDFYEQKWSEEIVAAKPYTDIQNSTDSISKYNFCVLSTYSLYFIISIPIIVHFFRGIEYGPNIPYISFLIIVGIPFLIAFLHILTKVDHQRNRLIASGLSKKDASIHVFKWIALTPCMMIFVIYIMLKLSNSFIK